MKFDADEEQELDHAIAEIDRVEDLNDIIDVKKIT